MWNLKDELKSKRLLSESKGSPGMSPIVGMIKLNYHQTYPD
jgi:hypothetical protein